MTNIFDKIIANQNAVEMTLGNPLSDPLAIVRRMTYFMHMRGGNGFRIPAMEPKRDPQGRTRGDRKRIAREKANDKARMNND